MNEATLTDEELINWFRTRTLPEGFYRISAWATTPNLPRMVELAVEHLRRNSDSSREVLMRLKAKLELESAGSV